MERIRVYLRKYPKESILAPLFKMLEALLDLFVPFVVASIINIGIKNNSPSYIFNHCMLLVVLAIIGLAFSVIAQYFAAKAAVGCATDLRHDLFKHIQSLGFSEMDTIGTNTLITRMTSDINQVQSGINLFLRLFLRSPFIVLGATIMAFKINVKAAMIFVITIPVLAIIIFGIMLITMPLYKKVQNHLDTVVGLTRENLNGVRVIRAFNKEKYEISNFENSNNNLTKAQLLVGRISSLMNPMTYLVINLAIIAIVKNGAFHVNTGDLLTGDVIALINYMSQILVELMKLANLIVQVTKAVACAGRVQSILNVQPTMTFPGESINKITTEKPAVTFSNVSLTYNNARQHSLSNINFTAKCGDTIGVIGGTGSGKSSLVNLIPRFYDATDGKISIFGTPIDHFTKSELRSRIGVVMQKAQLFTGTIRSNLLWGNEDATEEQLWNALETAQAAEFVRCKEKGLDAPIEQGGHNLSGGQRQRLTIARALVKNPDILILDDSSSALDFATDAALRQSLSLLPKNITIFIVSQRASSLQHADKILVLDEGCLVGSGTHSELINNCKVYQEIYESQFEKGENTNV